MSDYGDFCREVRDARKAARQKHGEPCPWCLKLLPRANPAILLPGQTCRIHDYTDPRTRTRETEYLHKSK